jgi:transcriptional regulator with XRE-family HTH domain
MLNCACKAELYNVDMSIGKRIKAARERLRPKLTQAQVGEKFGVTDKAVSAWERDDTVPELDKIVKLAKLLKVPCGWLLEGKGPPPDPDSLEVQIDQLQPSERAIIRSVIEGLRKERDNVA